MSDDKVSEAQKNAMKNIADTLDRLSSQQKKPEENMPGMFGQNKKFDVSSIWPALKNKAETTRSALDTDNGRSAVIAFHEALQDQAENLLSRVEDIEKQIDDIYKSQEKQKPEPPATTRGKNRVPVQIKKPQNDEKIESLREEIKEMRQAQLRISSIEDTMNRAGLRSPRLAPRDPLEAAEYISSNIRAINKIIPSGGKEDLSLRNLEQDAVMLAADDKKFSAEGVKNYNAEIDSSITAALSNQQAAQLKKDAEAGRAWGLAAERLKNMKDAINKAASFTPEQKEIAKSPEKKSPETKITPEKQAVATLFKIVDLTNRDSENTGSRERQEAFVAIQSFTNNALKEKFMSGLADIGAGAMAAIESAGDTEKMQKAANGIRESLAGTKKYMLDNKAIDPKGVAAAISHLEKIEQEIDAVAPKKTSMISPKDEFAHLIPSDIRDFARLHVQNADLVAVPAGGKQSGVKSLA